MTTRFNVPGLMVYVHLHFQVQNRLADSAAPAYPHSRSTRRPTPVRNAAGPGAGQGTGSSPERSTPRPSMYPAHQHL